MAYASTSLLNDLFDQLGDVTIAAHAKDFTVVEGLLPHFEEAVIGEGMLDQDTFLRRMLSVRPDAHVLIDIFRTTSSRLPVMASMRLPQAQGSSGMNRLAE